MIEEVLYYGAAGLLLVSATAVVSLVVEFLDWIWSAHYFSDRPAAARHLVACATELRDTRP